MKRKEKFKNYWWVSTEYTSIDSPYINLATALKFTNYTKLKAVIWSWFRSKLDRKDLGSREKIILWIICERVKGVSFSCWDSYIYLGKATGMNRKTVAMAVNNLSKAGLIVIAVEGSTPRAKKKLEAQKRFKKHILLVGIGYALDKKLEADKEKA